MSDEVGHVYRIVKRTPAGTIFQRCSAEPAALRQFKRRQQYKRLRPAKSPCLEGHTFLDGGPSPRGTFGFFRPSGVSSETVLAQIKSEYGVGSQIIETLWNGGIPESARG